MTEYIERELAVRCLEEHMTKTAQAGSKLMKAVYLMAKDHAIDYLNIIPTADVVEVRHGEWESSPDGIHPIKCSKCGAIAPYRYETSFTHDLGIYPYKANYCPNCGADMRGEKNGKV